MSNQPSAGQRPHVVVVGGGFAGINTVKGLRDVPVDITLVDRRNFHLFQPLTYQVATGALSPGEIAYPLRALFKSSTNVTVLLGEVTGFDLDAHEVRLAGVAGVPAPPVLHYDILVVGAGSAYSYFGHDEWAASAPEVKSLESALAARARILAAFERAEAVEDPAERQRELTFVVVGGGPTGVEMAGQIGELARDTLARDFRTIDSRAARILLVEAMDRLLGTFPPSLSAKAARSLEQLGVTPTLNRTVVGVDDGGVDLKAPDGTIERVPARTIIWAAGVRASSLTAQLGELSGAEVDRSGHLTVEPDLTLPGHPEVFAVGDMVRVRDHRSGDPKTLPGVAPVAIQQGHYTAKAIARRVR
ncbi:MAG TPA: FAD-dependent oxidoreductase, partial [Baekduia sp.]